MTKPTVQTAEAAAREFVNAALKDGNPDNDDYVTVSGLTRTTIANSLAKFLTTRDAAIRADERGKVLEEAAMLCEAKALYADEQGSRLLRIAKAIRALASPPTQPAKQD